MATGKGKPTKSQARKSFAAVVTRGTNFQPHQEATKRTLAKNRYYRVAPPVTEGSATAAEASGN